MDAATYDGIALMFWSFIGLMAFLCVAFVIEAVHNFVTDRRWIKRLHSIERGRAAQRGES